MALWLWGLGNIPNDFAHTQEPTAGPMLQTGPYHAIRHPMYAAALLLIWASVFGHFSLVTAIIGCVITFIIAVRIVTEDKFLLMHFPEYAEYKRTTKRVIPFLI